MIENVFVVPVFTFKIVPLISDVSFSLIVPFKPTCTVILNKLANEVNVNSSL